MPSGFQAVERKEAGGVWDVELISKCLQWVPNGKHTETEVGSSTVCVSFGHVFLSERKGSELKFPFVTYRKIISSTLLFKQEFDCHTQQAIYKQIENEGI